MDLTPAVDVGTTTAAVPRAAPSVSPTLPAPSEPALAEARTSPVSDPAYPAMDADALYSAQLAALGLPGDDPGAAPQAPSFEAPAPRETAEAGARSLAAEEEEQSVAMLAPPPPPMSEPAAVPAPAPRPAPPPVAAPAATPIPRAESHPKPILAGLMRLPNPFHSAPPAGSQGMPADEIACRRELKSLGVTYTDIPRIGDGGTCGIAYPVRVTQLSGGIRMRPAATLNCEMAATFAAWTKNELGPAARFRYLSGVKRINNGTYSCRRIAGSRTFSAHSRGNAIDIMSIDLDNGRNIDVTKPGFFAFRQRGLLNTVRKDGCQYFSTVLGPGYNYDHRNHFHFDLMHRKSGHRACR